MDKCRICLEYGYELPSLYDTDDKLSYMDKVNFIAAKKVFTSNKVCGKICLLCRKKVEEAYDFKVLIQRADIMELHKNHCLKIVNFSNLSDVTIKSESSLPDNHYSVSTNLNEILMSEEKCISYNDVLIKKVCNDTEKEKIPIPAIDVFENINKECSDKKPIKHESEKDYIGEVKLLDYGIDNDIDEYISIKQPKGKRKKKKRCKDKEISKVMESDKNINNNNIICIKPIHLNNVRVMYRDIKEKVKKKYKYYGKVRKDICPFCGKVTVALKSHLLIHTGERNFKCATCSKGYLSQGSLNVHMQKHGGTKNFKCDHCVAAFIDKASLKSHMISHSDQKKYVCDICNKGFKRKYALNRHVMTHNFGNKTVKCESCNMSFYNKVALTHHMRVHTGERPFKCEICTQPYSYKHDFNRHCFKKHGIFLKRRSIYVLNERVLMQERALMKDILLRTQGIMKDNKPLNPFKGPQAVLAFEQTITALKTKQISVDF